MQKKSANIMKKTQRRNKKKTPTKSRQYLLLITVRRRARHAIQVLGRQLHCADRDACKSENQKKKPKKQFQNIK
jgi:hypothetical protein